MKKRNSVALLAAVLLSFTFLICSSSSSSIDIRELKCLVCTRIVEEIQKNASKVDSRIQINVGGFRLDDNGNYVEKNVQYSKSEVFLTEVMENICEKMDDYVRATFKKTGKLTVIPLITGDGKMNPIMSEVDLVQDSDLNKSLKFYCQEIVDEHDEIFIAEFSGEQHDIVTQICGDQSQLCKPETIRLSRMTSDEL